MSIPEISTKKVCDTNKDKKCDNTNKYILPSLFKKNNIDKKEQVAFSFKHMTNNDLVGLGLLEPLPSLSTGISSKFSSCSSFDISISPINSGRSTPLQFQMDLEHEKSVKT